LDKFFEQLKDALLNNGRPVEIAFHIYEILSEAGCDDDIIEEISSALADIVSWLKPALQAKLIHNTEGLIPFLLSVEDYNPSLYTCSIQVAHEVFLSMYKNISFAEIHATPP